jgi:hypothetical protein
MSKNRMASPPSGPEFGMFPSFSCLMLQYLRQLCGIELRSGGVNPAQARYLAKNLYN